VLQQAAQRDVTFETECSQKPLVISTDPALAQQVLINALSHIVRQAQAGTLHMALRTDEKQVSLTLRYFPEPESAHTPAISNVVKQLADRLGWTVEQEDQPGNARTVRLFMATQCPTVLVIDDNEGLVKLLDSYLSGHACQVISAANGPEGLRLAQEQGPDAIVLDVMIPEMDGWEVLQRLRNHPQTANIPIIICSVLDSPELAYSLGASLFLSKPIGRDDILNALHEIGVA
jgi:CheY-like chemotaxis protein